MHLLIDIGNTRAKLVAMDHGEPVAHTLAPNDTLRGLDAFAARFPFAKAIVGSVGRLSREGETALSLLPFPFVRLTAHTPLPFGLSVPESMGADRVAAIVGAMARAEGRPFLIVDAGTCVTYEVVGEGGRYLGGNIAPGLRLRLRAMHEHTALLPLVDLEGPAPEEGYDTPTAMRAGCLRGLTYEIEGYIAHLSARFPSLQVFLTGGDKFTFSAETERRIQRDPYLVARGLDTILRYNSHDE